MVEGLTSFNTHPSVVVGRFGLITSSASRTAARGRNEDQYLVGLKSAADHVLTCAMDPGDPSGEATPVPIPNTEVKLSSAEDTQGVAPRENRSSPGSLPLKEKQRPRREASRAGSLILSAGNSGTSS